MPRRVYVSGDFPERGLAESEQLVRVLQANQCVVEWAPPPGQEFYRTIEEMIERCDAFVALVGHGYKVSTWLNHELQYADVLKRFRREPRPRILAVSLDRASLPTCSKHIQVEWFFLASDLQKLLEDLPPPV